MERFLEINQTINKPIKIVEEALTEGFNMHKKMGMIETVNYFPFSHKHSAQFAISLLCPKVNSAFVTVTTRQHSKSKNQTELNYIIDYESDKIGVIEKFYNNITFKPIVKYRSQMLLLDFKYRVEKWM
ncbi:hypothetical protein GCM10009117_25120 [Gangjinia marincola]|uniref:Uncharacterized protein n=1 Tax=Gangjinia marincola TaxID=578463 RepID=A0ABN1MJE3_9FLAO